MQRFQGLCTYAHTHQHTFILFLVFYSVYFHALWPYASILKSKVLVGVKGAWGKQSCHGAFNSSCLLCLYYSAGTPYMSLNVFPQLPPSKQKVQLNAPPWLGVWYSSISHHSYAGPG